MKMLFQENLHNIYKEIFYLTKIGFSAEYIESITPIERKLNWQYYQEDAKKQDENESGVQTFDALSPDLPDSIMQGT